MNSDQQIEAPTTETASRQTAPPRPACFFALGEELFAVEGSWAREVAVIRGATAVPRTASFVLGVGNLRGRVLPLIDLNPLLDREVRPPADEYLVLVTEVDGRWVGLVIDEVLRFGFFLDSTLKPAQGAQTGFPKRFLLGWLHLVGRPAQLIDTRRLLEELGAEGVISAMAADRGPAPFEPLDDVDSTALNSGPRTA